MAFRLLSGVSLFLLLVAAVLMPVVNAEHDVQYRLGAGDVINILVFGENDLSLKDVRLTGAGTFSYPFLGEVNAVGKTTQELEQDLIAGLKRGFLRNPQVSVSVAKHRDYFMNGEVSKSGAYAYSPGLTLRKAIAIAGGLTDRASTRRMTVIRESDPEQKAQKIELDDVILPGDIITIREGFF